MTQKDFIFLAGTILNLDCVDDATRQNIAEQFASRLRQTNPRFKSDLFVQAATGAVPLTARKAR